jgi:hypothetical protein
MTYGDALNALEVGFPCRFRGMQVIVAGVEVKRMARIDNSGRPYCVGDRFYSCRLLGAGKSGGHIYEGRLEELMTEEEYQKSKEDEHNG